jgi:iron complex transport system ATP-binding protein
MMRGTVARFDGVGFSYPLAEPRRGRPFALAGLSFDLADGEILGVLGPNSAGKTTLIRLLTRILAPTRGMIEIGGQPLAALSRAALARHIAVVPQDMPQGLPFTVQELVLMGRYPHAPRRFFETSADLAVAREAMTATGVLDLAATRVGILSGGERQRVALARALAQEPRLLVLDEPTAHLDLRYQVECMALLRRVNRERGTTVLLVSHDLSLAGELCDRLLLLADGKMARLGTPAEVLEATLLTAVYGCAVVVDRNPATGRPVVQVAWPNPTLSSAGRVDERSVSKEVTPR